MKNINIIPFVIFLTCICSEICISQVTATENERKENYSINLLTDFGKNSIDCFRRENILFHLGGIAGSYALISTGADYKAHNYFVKNDFMDKASTPGVYIGYLLPVAVSGALLGYGYSKDAPREKTAAVAVVQSVAVSVCYSSLLKLLTGRPNPEPEIYENGEFSKKFKFGFNNGGMHFGWPSGHMMTNTAMVTSLICFYKDNTLVNVLGGGYLIYLFLSVISHDKSTMHWLSDAATGTVMGYAIGSSIGKNFRNRYNNHFSGAESGYGLHVSSTGMNISVSFNF